MGHFVLSGGSGVGKTTIINLLKDKGYSVFPETTRTFIEEEKIILIKTNSYFLIGH